MAQRMEDRLKPEEYIGLAADLESDYLEVSKALPRTISLRFWD